MTAVGEVLWSPPADARARSEIGRYMDWLSAERGLDFADYDELHRWSVTDLEAFWGSIWDFFEIRAHTPYERVLGSSALPGAEWFPGARLNYAEHMVGRDEDLDVVAVAVVAYSQTREPMELTFGELRDQVARARAGMQRLGVGPGDRVVAYMPNIPETLVAFLAAASLGAIWATCPLEFGVRSVVDRLGQLEPTLLLLRPVTSGETSASTGASRSPRSARSCRRFATSSTSRTSAARTTCFRTRSRGAISSASPGRSSSTLCRSTIRCACSSPPGRPGCRRRSSTVTAASSSSI
jgi:hypothetical protein